MNSQKKFSAWLGYAFLFPTLFQGGSVSNPTNVGGGYNGPGDIVPTACPNTPCGFPDFPFTDFCSQISPASIGRRLFRPAGSDCFLPANSNIAYRRDTYQFRRCDFDELSQKVASGQIVPDANGNVTVSLMSGDLLYTGCGVTASQFPVSIGQMVELDESKFLDGTYLQGSQYPQCNAPLPVKPYLKIIYTNNTSSCLPLTGASFAAGNPILPHGSTLVENNLFQWMGPQPPAAAQCFSFELLVEFHYQCMKDILLRWDALLGDPMWSGEPLFVAKVLSCTPCATVPAHVLVEDDR